MVKVKFALRSPKSKSETSIYLILRWNYLRLVYPTGETVLPRDWGNTKGASNYQRVKRFDNANSHEDINTILEGFGATAKRLFRKYKADNNAQLPSIEEMRELLNIEYKRVAKAKSQTLFGFIDEFIEEATKDQELKGRSLNSNSVVNSYKQTRALLHEFKSVRKVRVDYDNITLDFYYEFIEFMENVKAYSVNNIGKHIKTLKTFLNDATDKGFNGNLAYKSKKFRVLSEDVDNIYLSEEEIEALYALDLSDNNNLERIRDLFVVGCWTGLRFSDFNALSQSNIRKDGMLEVFSQKTQSKVVIPIYGHVQSIIDKYDGGFPSNLAGGAFNREIKNIASRVESLTMKVDKHFTKGGKAVLLKNPKYELVSTHTARRSFATNQYLRKIPTISIMAVTGHKTEKAFLKYIKVTPDEHAQIMKEYWKNAQST